MEKHGSQTRPVTESAQNRWEALLCCLCFAIIAVGCQFPLKPTRPAGTSPSGLSSSFTSKLHPDVVVGNLIIQADFPFPKKHRLIDELRRNSLDLAELLQIELSDEPIQVRLFSDPVEFQRFAQSWDRQFETRRALFIKTDTQLTVYCLWGDRVAEDLRHEITHANLHSLILDVPLWLDEGLAEYFELPRSFDGVHRDHLAMLTASFKSNTWTPNLSRLAMIQDASSLSQLDYAECWLWVHYLAHSSLENKVLLVEIIDQLRSEGSPEWAIEAILRHNPQAAHQVLDHLQQLANQYR